MALVVAACGGGDDEAATPKTSTTTAKPVTTTTESPATTSTTEAAPAVDHVAITAGCPGIGPAPSSGEITFIADGELLAAAPDGSPPRCLFETSRSVVAWGGAADRVLVGDHTVVLADGPKTVGDDSDRLLSWSRPTGKALLAETADDTLIKYSIDDGATIGIFEAESTESAYHPAGLSIITAVPQGDRPSLLMTSNTGENPRWIVENETAHAIHDLAFTASGALVFIADHDDGSQHVHQLPLDSEAPDLATLYEPRARDSVGAVAVSPFHDDWYAVGADCTGRAALHVVIESQIADIPAAIVAAEPIGWMPDGGLFVLTHPDGCDQPGDLYGFRDGEATLVNRGVDGAAVRAVLPPPPPPPAEIEAAPA